MHEIIDFDDLALRLEDKIYSSAKGLIRLNLLKRDLEDFIPGFRDSSLCIDDIGGGAGHFALSCVQDGHDVRIIEKSAEMINILRKRLEILDKKDQERIELIHADYLTDRIPVPPSKRHIICLHGSAEWMKDSKQAIQKACSEAETGTFMSLLIFNIDRQNLKLGINGQLHPVNRIKKRRKLTPPGGLTSKEVRSLIESEGEILLQSGIRIFHDFFRQFDPGTLSDRQWLEQEIEWYRKDPFNRLGEHSHFIWIKK